MEQRDRVQLFYKNVFQLHILYVNHFLQHFTDPSSVYDFGKIENYALKFGAMDLTKQQFAAQVKNYQNLDKDLIDLDMIDDDNLKTDRELYTDQTKDKLQLDVAQNQELVMAQNLLEKQLDSIN